MSSSSIPFRGVILTSNGVHDAASAHLVVSQLKLIVGEESIVNMRVVYIANAADTYRFKPHINRSIRAWLDLGVDLSIVDLDDHPNHIKKELSEVKVVYVEGGNTFHLLYHFRKSKVDSTLFAYPHLIYVGSSAGSIIAGPNILPASLAGDSNRELDQTDMRGLAIVPFMVWPHYGVSSRWRAFFSMPGREKQRTLFFKKITPLRDGEIIIMTPRHRLKVLR